MFVRRALIGAALSLSLVGGTLAAPATAQVVASDPSQFVRTLSDTAFTTLRTGSKPAARAKFKSLLSQHFAIEQIGDRLISQWRPKITPAQYSAYKAALPDFLIGTYADRLYDYADAKLTVVTARPSGNSAAVLTKVQKPGGRPVTAIWTVQQVGGAYKVVNLTVGGVNLSLAQAADFNSYAQRNGFDKLVAFMKARG